MLYLDLLSRARVVGHAVVGVEHGLVDTMSMLITFELYDDYI